MTTAVVRIPLRRTIVIAHRYLLSSVVSDSVRKGSFMSIDKISSVEPEFEEQSLGKDRGHLKF